MKWLQERLIIYPRIIITFYVLAFAILLVSGLFSPSGLTDFLHRPLGEDFSPFWMASHLSLAGTPGTVYDFPKFVAAMENFFQVRVLYPWFYPPTFLLLVYPLACLPYLPSLFLWLGLTMGGYLAVLRRIAPHPQTIWLALAFPGTFENFMHGQNGFLSALFLGGGLLLLDRQPLAGGVLLGLLSYKPHLLPLVPVALIAGRRWRGLLGVALGALALAVGSYLVFGQEVWLLFFKNSSLTLQLFQEKSVRLDKMITLLAAAIQYGASFRLAWLLQGAFSLGIAALVAFVWYREPPLAIRASALALGMLLVPPQAFPYDLALLALPLAWLGWEGYNNGWAPGEQILLFIGWLSPLAVVVLNFLGLYVAPLILMALLLLALKRSRITMPHLKLCEEELGKPRP
jgi:hypothetical protein